MKYRKGHLNVAWNGDSAGYVINSGFAADKLYYSYMVFDTQAAVDGLVIDQYFLVKALIRIALPKVIILK